MTIKDEVAEFLQNSGTPATPKHIAEAIGRGTAGNIARALRELTDEGKLIKYETGKQNSWRVYKWNPDYTDSKFTVGSEWKTRGGEKAVVTCSLGGGMFIALVAGYPYTYLTNGEFRGRQGQHDLIAPWSEPKPEEKSELQRLLDKTIRAGTPSHFMLSAIITAIEALQNPVEKPVDALKRSGEVWVNIYSDNRSVMTQTSRKNADECAREGRIACVRVPWVEGEGL